MLNNKQKTYWWIIIAFMIVPGIISIVSSIHVVSFFELSNYVTISVVLATAFEIGALSSLAGLVVMDKINKSTVWTIFILLTLFQMMGNTYYSYDVTTTKMIQDYDLIKNFTELFGFNIYDNSDVIFVKRVIAIFSGAILPVISLCFLHLLMNYIIKSSTKIELNNVNENNVIEPAFEFITEPITEPILKENSQEEDFIEHLKTKKEKLEKDRASYSELLKILYKDGTAQNGEELPSYKDFVTMVDKNKFDNSAIKMFLTLCNYLSITKVSGEQKMALKSYEEAKTTLDGYLTFGNI